MVHPYHPLRGKTFEKLYIAENWAYPMVFFYGPKHKLEAVPVRWTTLVSLDTFVRRSRGRAPFRPEDLLELAALIRTLRTKTSQPPSLEAKEVK